MNTKLTTVWWIQCRHRHQRRTSISIIITQSRVPSLLPRSNATKPTPYPFWSCLLCLSYPTRCLWQVECSRMLCSQRSFGARGKHWPKCFRCRRQTSTRLYLVRKMKRAIRVVSLLDMPTRQVEVAVTLVPRVAIDKTYTPMLSSYLLLVLLLCGLGYSSHAHNGLGVQTPRL